MTPGEQVLLRVFLDTFQKHRHRPVYELLVERARSEGVAGATVLRGLEGFGQNGRILRESPWRLANDREVVVEFVDAPERIDAFLGSVEPLLQDAVVTLERAEVVFRRGCAEGPRA